MTKHNSRVVEAFWRAHGIPLPEVEYRFHDKRKWRFDYAWLDNHGNTSSDLPAIMTPALALEVQGGLFVRGAHARGGYIVQEHEKRNESAALGWRIIYVQPRELLTTATANLVKRCLGIT